MNLVSQVLLASWVKNLSFPGPGGPSCCSRIVQSTEGRKPTKISGFFSEENLNRKRIFCKATQKTGKRCFCFAGKWYLMIMELQKSWPIGSQKRTSLCRWFPQDSTLDDSESTLVEAVQVEVTRRLFPVDFLCSIRFQLGILCMNLVLILRVARVSRPFVGSQSPPRPNCSKPSPEFFLTRRAHGNLEGWDFFLKS